jgi:hypothetical protein
MFRKKIQKFIEQEAEIIYRDKENARKMRSRISKEIAQRKIEMEKRRENFRLIRNK